MNLDTGIGFDALFENAAMGILVTNEKGTIVLANPFLLNQFDYHLEDILGQSIQKLIPTRFHQHHGKHVAHYMEHPNNRPMGLGMDLFAVRNDGTEFPVEVSLSNYDTSQGKYVIAFLSDISKRKTAENALQHLNEALEQKVQERTQALSTTVHQLAESIAKTEAKDLELKRINTFFSSIWEHAEAIIFVTDASGIIKMYNSAAERQLGYKTQDVVGKQSPILFMEGGQESYQTLINKAIEGLNNEGELTYIRQNGDQFPVSQTFTAMRNEEQAVEGFLCVALDISERKQAEVELRSALEKEKELSELKSRFVSMASHEFRTPLSTVLSSAYLISKYEAKEDHVKREKHVQRIISAVNTLTDILNDFLSVGKIEEGKIQVRYAEFDINKYLQQTTNELEGLLKKGQSIQYIHEGAETLILDPSLLKHILLNLLSNAIKFSPENSVIVLHSNLNNSCLTIQVKDQGCGIPMADQAHLFQRFFRAANVTHIQGTGLGLHIVNKYTELMNGVIHCLSEEGQGTTFELKFSLQ
jgi:PAS domain S-box-containing protein